MRPVLLEEAGRDRDLVPRGERLHRHDARMLGGRARAGEQLLFLDLAEIGALEEFGGQDDLRALRDRSEEHTSELQSLMRISYAVFCLKKKKNTHIYNTIINYVKDMQENSATDTYNQ